MAMENHPFIDEFAIFSGKPIVDFPPWVDPKHPRIPSPAALCGRLEVRVFPNRRPMRDATSASGASTLRRQEKPFGKPEKPQDPIKTHGIGFILLVVSNMIKR